MKKFKVVLIFVIAVILFFTFNVIEFEPLNQATSKYFQSLLFVLTFIIVTLKPKYRIKIFYLTFPFIFIMIGFYLLGSLALANSLSSMILGILFITSLTYLPVLIKKGFVEKL